MNSLLEALIAAKLSGSGGGGGGSGNAVLYTEQPLTDAQQAQARANIGAVSLDEIGTVFTLKGGVATVADLPASGNNVGDVYYVETVSAGYIWLTSASQPNGYWEELGETFDVTVDSELSNTSENPVQNKVINAALAEKGTYSKPSSGIPKSDLASTVQTSLEKADTALQPGELPYVTPQRFGAKGDGVTDDTAAINDCFASGASNIYFPPGTYLVDAHHAGFGHETEGGLRPQSNSVITLDPDAIIKCSTAPTDFYNILHFVNVENVIVKGGKIVGDKATHVQISQPTYEFGHGVGIQNSTNIVVRNMEICDCIGDGLILNYGGNYNVTLDNITIHDCRRQGVSLVSGNGIVISNCKIYDIAGTNPQAGIDIEPDGERAVTNVVIDSCNIHNTVGASVIVTNVSNVIDQIHINGCLLAYALFLGGSNVTMSGGKSARVCVKSNIAPIISACSIEEIWVGGGSAIFDGCNFISSGKEKVINVLSDVVGGNPVEGIVFSDCYFDVTGCTHFLHVPGNGVEKVKLIEFKDCSATVTHLVTESYAYSGFSNFMPSKMVISGSRFCFAAKIYQLFTMLPGKAATLEITDSEIVNSNSYRTNYFLAGNATYDVWIEHSKLTNYDNMLYGGGDASIGEVVLLNDTFDFGNPVGKVSADGVTITNISRENTKYLSGVRSNIQAQLDGIPTKTSDLENDSGYLTSVPVQSVNGKTGAVDLDANDVGALPNDTPIPAAVTEQTVSGWGFTKNTGTYIKPASGIPKTDLAEDVQTSLGKADTALQEHQSLSGYATESWVNNKGYLTLADLPVYNGGVT